MTAAKKAELKSEAEIYLSLDHPHVARLEMVYETDDELHLVMEYMAGGELFDRLAERTRYTEKSAAEATHQMLLALAYLHAHGIAHRDLKLENFLYERKDTNHLKIIDFGFSQAVDPTSKMSRACGTIDYIAPEVLRKSYDEKADMWSMGVIVYMLLTGRPPYNGTEDVVLKKIRRGAVDWCSEFHELSSGAKDFLKALLVRDPAERLSAQEALEHHWVTGVHPVKSTPLDHTIVESLRAFANASQFRRNVLSLMAWSLSTEDNDILRQQFLSVDKDKGGTISLREFKEVLASNFGIGEAEAEDLFSSLDVDGNQEVEYSEFLAALLGRSRAHEHMIRKAFSRFDLDGDGTLDKEELRRLFNAEASSDADIRKVLGVADTSGDGKLDYEEFLEYLYEGEAKESRDCMNSICTGKVGLLKPLLSF